MLITTEKMHVIRFGGNRFLILFGEYIVGGDKHIRMESNDW